MDRNSRRNDGSGDWETTRRIAAARKKEQGGELNVIGGTGNAIRSQARSGASGRQVSCDRGAGSSAQSGPTMDMLSGGGRRMAAGTNAVRSSARQGGATDVSARSISAQRSRSQGTGRAAATGSGRTGGAVSRGSRASGEMRAGSGRGQSDAYGGRSSSSRRVAVSQRPPLGAGGTPRGRRRRRRGMGPGILLILVVLVVAAVGGAFFYIRNRNQEQMQAYAQEGARLLEQGDYEGAIEALDAALAKSGNRIGEFEEEVLACRAEAEYREGDYEAALVTWQKLMEADPDNTDYKTGAVMCLIETGDLDAALQIGVAQGRIYNQMAVQRIAIEDYEMAEQYITLGKAYTDDETAQKELAYNEAIVAEGTGDYEKALRLFQTWVETYGSTEDAEREIEFLRTRVDNADEILSGNATSDSADSDEEQDALQEEETQEE
ncbi:MAG: tetratricopeptide repeat protein [Clostridiales bacterium]|nr:tetratricopeptide repeat protein [Clostridiales bacterium]